MKIFTNIFILIVEAHKSLQNFLSLLLFHLGRVPRLPLRPVENLVFVFAISQRGNARFRAENWRKRARVPQRQFVAISTEKQRFFGASSQVKRRGK